MAEKSTSSLKNSGSKPSDPGAFPVFRFLIADFNSDSVGGRVLIVVLGAGIVAFEVRVVELAEEEAEGLSSCWKCSVHLLSWASSFVSDVVLSADLTGFSMKAGRFASLFVIL